MTNPNLDPLVGRTVGQYEILARVGGGGMGVVYTARDTRLTRIVALKFLPPQWRHDATAKERFVREAQAASATNHPNICTIHDIETADDGQLFIVMAYYEGQTLKARLESGPLPIEEALDIAMQAADGLAKAHAQGVVHRDIKPGNLILTEDGVRILDFGLATFVAALKLTAENATLGTVAYMSPEQVRGQHADARTDVWATGAVLYEMLTGHAPFRGSHAEAIGYAVRNEQPTPIRELRPAVPEGVEQLVFRALHKEPSVRFASGRELARAIRQVRGLSVPLELITEPVAVSKTHSRRDRRRRWLAWSAAVIAVVAAVAVVGLTLASRDRVGAMIVPIANETGLAELEPYRLALTHSLIDRLSDSSDIRVAPFSVVLAGTDRFVRSSDDPSSRQAIGMLSATTGVQVVIAPTLINENGLWRARVDISRIDQGATGATGETLETAAVPSALWKQTAFDLVAELASRIQQRYASPGERLVAAVFRRGDALGRVDNAARRLESERWLVEGLGAHEGFEYGKARSAFARAWELDPSHALAALWLGRESALMRRDDEAIRAADRAAQLVDGLSEDRQLQFRAAIAEARRDFSAATEGYRRLIERHPDEAIVKQQLARALEEQDQLDAAIELHTEVRKADVGVRSEVELCRLYNRKNEAAKAKEHATAALSQYERLGFAAGVAEARLCLADALRVGSRPDREEAGRQATQAVTVLRDLDHRYNLARAYNYQALATAAQGNLANAAAIWENAILAAHDADNRVIEPLLLMNLGIAYASLGNPARAAGYRLESYKRFEALGDGRRAAENQANGGALLIEYGDDPARGFRDVDNALNVFRNLGDRRFEVFCLQVIGAYHRYAGRYDVAEQSFQRALSISKQRDSKEKFGALAIDIGRTFFDRNDYERALTWFEPVAADVADHENVEARIRLAAVLTRLAEYERARQTLDAAAAALNRQSGRGMTALLHLVRGELAVLNGDLRQARRSFQESDAVATTAVPYAASIEARADLALVEAQEGHLDRAADLAASSLQQAARLGRLALQVRCRLVLAQIEIAKARFERAIAALEGLPPADGRQVGLEVQAQIHYWRGRALRARGDPAADVETRAGRELAQQALTSLTAPHQNGVRSRRDVEPILR